MKCTVGEMTVGKMNCRRNVLSAKCTVDEMNVGEMNASQIKSQVESHVKFLYENLTIT